MTPTELIIPNSEFTIPDIARINEFNVNQCIALNCAFHQEGACLFKALLPVVVTELEKREQNESGIIRTDQQAMLNRKTRSFRLLLGSEFTQTPYNIQLVIPENLPTNSFSPDIVRNKLPDNNCPADLHRLKAMA